MANKAPAKRSAQPPKRLRPGELDGIVLAYMREHTDDGPLTAPSVGRGVKRSSGAVANCLARLAKTKKVRLAERSPRTYVLREARGR